MKIKELLEYGKNNLIKKEDAIMLSKMLLKYLLEVDNTYLVINRDEEISKVKEIEFKDQIKKLNLGVPIQYITNHQEFMKLHFYVDENVLIPQPDTEILVEEVVSICKQNKKYNILDLCTGSGAIGISLSKHIEDSEITMLDISSKALEIAKKNAIKNNVIERCKFIQSDMFKNINNKFEIIVSNPPYIKTKLIKVLDKEVQNEPMLALDGGEDGLDFYRTIAEVAWKYLKDEGILALEIGYDQKENVIKILEEQNKYKDIYCKKDLAGNDRIVVCKLK